jgi:hypothetical protein
MSSIYKQNNYLNERRYRNIPENCGDNDGPP